MTEKKWLFLTCNTRKITMVKEFYNKFSEVMKQIVFRGNYNYLKVI